MDMDEIINDLMDRFWTWRLLDIPEFATFVGVHIYDDRLMDMSINGYLRRRDDARTWLVETKHIRSLANNQEISNESKIHLDYLEHDLEVYLQGLTFQTYLCPLNPTDGPHVRFPRLLTWMKRDTVEDFDLILTRLRQFPRQIGQVIELMGEGIRLGKTAYIKTVESYPASLKKVSETPYLDSPTFAPFKEKPCSLSHTDWERIVAQAKQEITTQVLPAFKCLGEFIRDVYIPKTRPGLGVGSLPNGKEIYEACVRFHTGDEMTAEKVFNLGNAKLKDLMVEIEEQRKKVGFSGTCREFMEHLRTDPKYAFKTREEMVEVYESECERIEKLLPQLFSKLPKIGYKVVPAPAEIEKTYVAGAYVAGDLEKGRPGWFLLNTYSPQHRKRYDIPALILHEVFPGHHIQVGLSAESSLKEYRRFADELRYWDLPAHLGMKTAYHEGWATYAEYLGHELGLYNDQYDYLGSLSRQCELACRYVVDVGLHVYDWTREQAVQFMRDNSMVNELECQIEVNRYTSLPGQSLAYLYGCDRFIEFRKKAETALGDAFDVRVFHTMLASLGDVALFIVEGQVDKFIADRKIA